VIDSTIVGAIPSLLDIDIEVEQCYLIITAEWNLFAAPALSSNCSMVRPSNADLALLYRLSVSFTSDSACSGPSLLLGRPCRHLEGRV